MSQEFSAGAIPVPNQRYLLRPHEAATFLALSERTLWQLTRSGEVPRVLIGRSVRYDPRELIAWVERKKGQAS
jgi:excisionase family DNA binding protein